ncbi:MAG: hypothetical protein R6U63_10550 [Longimicrobiales bacterium]
MTPFGPRRILKTLVVLSVLILIAPGGLAAEDCTTRYSRCLSTWDTYVISPDYHDKLCFAEYIDCVTQVILAS